MKAITILITTLAVHSGTEKINFDASGHFYVNGLKGLVRFNLGEPDSGILFHSSTNGTYDAKCLLNGNILIADYNSLREYTGTGVYVRNINPAPAYAMNYLKGIEYDSESNSIFVAHSGTSADPRNFVKLDYTTGQFVSATEFRHGNDLVLATDGRIVAGSWSLRPGIFTQDPTQIGSFTGGNTNPMFVTQLVPEPASALFLGLAALAFRRRRR
ncbi:MAG: PEP-CTERM sorting domain-containing protein [Planctomycetes bacterium]|nr:PEP-CTERM sorting domain-containing protein [Planctomycetota bacterium]